MGYELDLEERPPPYLEQWYRDYLAAARYDISSSGVYAYSFGRLRELLGLSTDELDAVILADSVSFGGALVRQAIADRYAHGDVSRVMVTHGSSESIALVLSTLLRAGQRVALLDPIYHSLHTFAEIRGCQVSRIPVELFAQSAECQFPEISEGIEVVIVNFPHNPTGISLSYDKARWLIRRAGELGATLVWDLATAELPMDDEDPLSPENFPANHVTFGTFSKAFGLPGLRLGWCIAPARILERTLSLRDRTTLFLSPLIETIAARAVAHADVLIGPRRAEACMNLDHLDDFIREHEDELRWVRPRGGVCGLMEIIGESDTEEFCLSLLSSTGTLLVPGRAFERPRFVRIGYGCARQELMSGLDALASFLRFRRHS
jgi:capreomycidine synthase